MKQNWMQKIARFIKEHKMKKQWQMAATVMAAVVVFSTTYALILPAITLTKDNVYTSSDCQTASNSQKVHVGQMNSGSDMAAADVQTPSNATQEIYYCGFEAHTHDKDCYNDEGHLVCEETVHVHTDECLIQFTEEELALIQNVIDMIAELPTSEEAEAALEAFETENDKEGFEAYVKAIAEIAWAAHDAYEALDEELQAEVTNIDLLRELEWLWSKTILFEYPSLEADGAYVSKLKEKASNVITDSEEEPDPMTVQHGDAIEYQFSVETDSYSDMYYSEGRVKVEFVLPFAAEEAEFDLTDMNWLDSNEGYEAAITTETRTIGDEEIECQVLTGYKHFAAEEASEEVIPGNFTGNVVVSVNEMEHNEEIAILISAAMEYNEWDGECAEHERKEKLTITTDEYKVYAPLSPEEQKVIYEAFLAEVEEAEANGLWTEELRAAAEELLERVQEAYAKGEISEEYFAELSERLEVVLGREIVAELGESEEFSSWDEIIASGWFEEYSEYGLLGDNDDEDQLTAVPMMFKSRARMAAAIDAEAENDNGEPSDYQVEDWGGTNSNKSTNVSVSKTIDGTDTENVFDITLTVNTQQNFEELYLEPDMAVVVVMDISNSMNKAFGSQSRYFAAMDAAETFLDSFAANSGEISRIGYVVFNSNATKIFDLTSCNTAEEAGRLKNTMRNATKAIIRADGYGTDPSRFTNIEAGLKMGRDVISKATNKNKYIIFLSDGFPTTYIKSGYTGYNTSTSTGKKGADGVFYDYVKKVYCSGGTDYSDKGAIRARKMATGIKESGIKIFSIGIDIGGQTIAGFDAAFGSNFSTLDRTGTTYEIGSANDTNAFKTWIGDSIGSGYDEGYYYDSTDTEGLKEAYRKIFATIQKLNQQSSLAEWVAVDPMPEIISGQSAYDTVEFIGFYPKGKTNVSALTSSALSGKNVEDGENAAQFDQTDKEIKWDLKNSGYSSTTNGNKTDYKYQLTYRVRLKNELPQFIEKGAGEARDNGTMTDIYPTNNPTQLTYKVFETVSVNGVVQDAVSEDYTLDFPIPAVHGYLGELQFQKIDSFGKPVAGAEFTLTHDTDNCSICRGDNTTVDTVVDYVEESDANGKVTFARIPSGHKYTLVETRIPTGHMPGNSTYVVNVAYDVTKVFETKDGVTKEWKDSDRTDAKPEDYVIVNHTSYELPQTGGPGTWFYTLSGLLLTVGTMIFGFIQRREQERRAM